MKDRIQQYKNQIIEFWQGMTRKQKWLIISSFIGTCLILSFVTIWASRPNFVPLYNNLSPAEAGEIVAAIESRGIPVELSPDGSAISVPKKDASRLKVELSSEGIPRSGNINYSIFSENMGWGTTDRQLDVVERDAMQNELRDLIEQIDGIERAEVMITLPKDSIWLADEAQEASAAVVIHTRTGLRLEQPQINGLYHLISKSVPQLPPENILLMNQYMQPFELSSDDDTGNSLVIHEQQRQIKRGIEQDIQRELQRMLGSIFGMDKIVVSVFAQVDFTQESREEHLVEPVADDEGLEISVERIQEMFEGGGQLPGGLAGTGDTEIAGYQGLSGGDHSEYERIEERINREVNRIQRQIVASPYTVTDLAINVGVDESIAVPEVEAGIQDLLSAVIQTSVGDREVAFDEEQLAQRITIFNQAFPTQDITPPEGISNIWVYVLIAVLAITLILLAFLLLRRRREDDISELSPMMDQPEADLLAALAEDQSSKLNQIQKLAKERPDEFVKLLKSWMVDE